MNGRVLDYYHAVTDPDFARYMIEGTGLPPECQEIAWSFRRYRGDSFFFARKARMSDRQFAATAAGIHRRMMDELLRLALIGWRTERKNTEDK